MEVDERLTRDEASDDQREMCKCNRHRVEMHESVSNGQSAEVDVVRRRW